MSKLADSRKQHLNVTQSQLGIDNSSRAGVSPLSEDFESKVVAAQQQLEQLQHQQDLVERQKKELEELTERKEEFLEGQVDVVDRLTSALTSIDRELFVLQKEMEDLEQTRKCFAEHQSKIDGIRPEGWSREELKQELTRAISMLDHAEDEYDEAMSYFTESSRSSVFGGATATKKAAKSATRSQGEFATMFKQGLAFNLPLFVLGVIALMIYLNR